MDMSMNEGTDRWEKEDRLFERLIYHAAKVIMVDAWDTVNQQLSRDLVTFLESTEGEQRLAWAEEYLRGTGLCVERLVLNGPGLLSKIVISRIAVVPPAKGQEWVYNQLGNMSWGE